MNDEEILKRIKYAQIEAELFIAQQNHFVSTLVGGAFARQTVEFPEIDVMHVFLGVSAYRADKPTFSYKLKLNERTATWVGGPHPWGGKVSDINIEFPDWPGVK